ncbi:MAG: hypothetical protein WB992_13565 [Bryobacteraceae bacterium]
MEKSQITAATLAAVVIAAAVALTLLPGPLDWVASIGGFSLLLILLAYDREGYRSLFQSLAFSAVFGVCLMLASAGVIRILTGVTVSDARFSHEWLPLTWACATAVFWGIDRARMSGRQFSGETHTVRPVTSPRTFVPEFAPPPLPAEPPRPAEPPQPAEPPRADAPPAAIPIKPGKESMIYVNLVGEGLNVLRSVRAEHLGRDFYKITDSMPDGETWEYQPGQVVRCKKKNLSSGKGLVAVEEAPRAQ